MNGSWEMAVRVLRWPLTAVAALATAGCATILSGSDATITVTSDPSGAVVKLCSARGSLQESRTPASFKLSKNAMYGIQNFTAVNRMGFLTLEVAKEGYQPTRFSIEMEDDPIGLLGAPCLFPLLVDLSTGAHQRPVKSDFHAVLVKAADAGGASAPEPDAAALRLVRTRVDKPLVTRNASFSKSARDRTVAVAITAPNPEVFDPKGEVIDASGIARRQSSPLDLAVPSVVSNVAEILLAEQCKLKVVTRKNLDEVLKEQQIAQSGLTQEQIDRIGKLKIADYIAVAIVTSASYDNRYPSDNATPIRVARFGVVLQIIDVATSSIVFQGSHDHVATDLLDADLVMTRADLDQGAQAVESRLPSAASVIRRTLEELLAAHE